MIVEPHERGSGRGLRAALVVALIAGVGGGAYYATMQSPAPVSPPKSGHSASQTHTYTVRGRIEELPDPDRPSATLMIHHEEIADFARKDGTLGMAAMTMSFPTAPGVGLDGLAVGDKVEFTMELNWSTVPIYRITGFTKLSADTPLQISDE